MTDRRRAAARALVLATAIAIVLAAARRLDILPNGLRGQYFPNTDWSGEPAKTIVDRAVSTGALFAALGGEPPPEFSVAWSGWIIAPRDDAYTFATTSDDGSSVYVDGQLVVDNGGPHAPATKTGPTIRLARGPHAVFVKYFQGGGGAELEWLWQRGAEPFEAVPSWALRPRRIEFGRFVVDRTLEVAGTLAIWGWAAAAVAAAVFAFRPELDAAVSSTVATQRQLAAERSWLPLVGIVAVSTGLNCVGMWWGLPGGAWAGDELIPKWIMSGWDQQFSFGWWDKYPPLHYYIIALAYLPVFALNAIVRLPPILMDALLIVNGRMVSVVMAAGTVVATFFVGRRAFGPRAGLFAAGMVALTAPFVYYAKVANVDAPYTFWFALSVIFYLRVLDGGTTADFVGWGMTAALAVCTKDQAYGLYLLMPVPVIVQMWRRGAPIVRQLLAAAIPAAVTFALVHNVVFNAAGFATHVQAITGSASVSYRVFEPTIAGRLALLAATLKLIPRSWGWPMSVIALAGIVLAIGSPDRRRIAVSLLVPVVSYYLTFINVVLYNYDRFMLPVFVILAAYGGYALDRFTRRGAARPLREAAVAVAFAYTFVYSATVDALMLTDSRYAVERWLRAHVGPEDVVGMTSAETYMPRTPAIDTVAVPDTMVLDTLRPPLVIVNPDYTVIESPDTPLGQAIAAIRGGRNHYRLAFAARSPNPWPWLPAPNPDLVGDRRNREIVSFLRNINPTIEIYQRAGDR